MDQNEPPVHTIKQYVQTSFGSNHDFRLNVHEISQLFLSEKPQLQGSNVRLLFHGTKLSAILSILENGFYLPETEDGMFGKGVYFTDVSTKAARYTLSKDSPVGDSGYLLLCEVDLGNMKATYVAEKWELPKEYDSRACIGQYQPDMKGFKQLGNAKFPDCTQLIMQNPKLDLNYNEYVVYDTNRIRPKYLLKITKS
ncbi:Poly [ADP-ribose] polymerase 2 [Cichlidogyrus casuarinus]|uniref:Poly [ADP-ribose] polymerase n=1 Tax=Cichlidogyrus casuarinus TaxID=1844966 RepID=A0ABD2Q3E5_9PLAT